MSVTTKADARTALFKASEDYLQASRDLQAAKLELGLYAVAQAYDAPAVKAHVARVIEAERALFAAVKNYRDVCRR